MTRTWLPFDTTVTTSYVSPGPVRMRTFALLRTMVPGAKVGWTVGVRVGVTVRVGVRVTVGVLVTVGVRDAEGVTEGVAVDGAAMATR